MEIRREIHEGALASLRQAMLPMAAAVGGGTGALYLGIVHSPADQQGWAVPTATDIAFAVGVLALLASRFRPTYVCSCLPWRSSMTLSLC